MFPENWLVIAQVVAVTGGIGVVSFTILVIRHNQARDKASELAVRVDELEKKNTVLSEENTHLSNEIHREQGEKAHALNQWNKQQLHWSSISEQINMGPQRVPNERGR